MKGLSLSSKAAAAQAAMNTPGEGGSFTQMATVFRSAGRELMKKMRDRRDSRQTNRGKFTPQEQRIYNLAKQLGYGSYAGGSGSRGTGARARINRSINQLRDLGVNVRTIRSTGGTAFTLPAQG